MEGEVDGKAGPTREGTRAGPQGALLSQQRDEEKMKGSILSPPAVAASSAVPKNWMNW